MCRSKTPTLVNSSLNFGCLSDSPRIIVYIIYSIFEVTLFDGRQDNCYGGFPEGPEARGHRSQKVKRKTFRELENTRQRCRWTYARGSGMIAPAFHLDETTKFQNKTHSTKYEF